MTVFTRTITAMSVLLLLSTLTLSQITDPSIAVESLLVTPAQDAVEFTINSTERVPYTYFELAGPRLVVDFHRAENALGFSTKEVDHAGVDRVRAFLFADADGEVTRLVFDLEEETPYEVTSDGEGEVRVHFRGGNARQQQVTRTDADDRLANLGALDYGTADAGVLDDRLANLGLLNPPYGDNIFESPGNEAGHVFDSVEIRPTADVLSVSTVTDAEVEVDAGIQAAAASGIDQRGDEVLETVDLDTQPFETAPLDTNPQVSPVAYVETVEAPYELETVAAVVDIEAAGERALATFEEAEAEAEQPDAEIVREASLDPIAVPVVEQAAETVSVDQGLLASISTSGEFEVQEVAPSIAVEEFESQVPLLGNSGAFLQQTEARLLPPQRVAELIAESVPGPGVAAAPLTSEFLVQTVEALPTPQYTGEIATFDFRDLDLQDFFRLIGDISGLNVVLDPAVNGTVTLLLRAVPWDQALDVVLRNNNLGYELEGNVLRVATRATLQAEEDAARQLREAQELNAQLMTETFILSYTQSATVSSIIQDLLSPRGTIITDARRNALIVTDIPSQFGRVESLVSFLDTPAQQVEIEARLLSASKSFSRDLGTQIGLLVGNNSQNSLTGLPGSGSPFIRTPEPGVNIAGALPLITDFPVAGSSGLSFLLGAGGDILLDSVIQAAENRRYGEIVIPTENHDPEQSIGYGLPGNPDSRSDQREQYNHGDVC